MSSQFNNSNEALAFWDGVHEKTAEECFLEAFRSLGLPRMGDARIRACHGCAYDCCGQRDHSCTDNFYNGPYQRALVTQLAQLLPKEDVFDRFETG